MATAKQYASQVFDVQRAIARKMGMTLAQESKGVRVLVKSTSIVIGVLMKLLVDKAVLTNAELTGAFAFVNDDTYPDEPIVPPDEVTP